MAAPIIIVKEGSCVIEVHRKGGGPNTLLASLTLPEANFKFKGSHVDVDGTHAHPHGGPGGKLEYRIEFEEESGSSAS